MKTRTEQILAKMTTNEIVECISRLELSNHSPNSPLRKLAAEVCEVPVEDVSGIHFVNLSVPLAKEMANRYVALKHGEEE
jgi:hypothetical protein